MSNKDNKELIKDIENFVVNNPELEELEKHVNRINLFDVLKVSRNEVVHSAFLAWLMDPKANHGLGDIFLKKFLKRTVLNAESELLCLTPVDIDSLDFSTAEVKTEVGLEKQGYIDISVILEEHSFVCYIENKIGSPEGVNQTGRYFKGALEKYRKEKWKNQLFIFLTPEGTPAKHEEFVSQNYGVIHNILKSILESQSSQMGGITRMLLEQYLYNLEVNMIGESKVDELCRKIYKTHRKALDLIFEKRPNIVRQTYEKIIETIGQDITEQKFLTRCAGISYCPIWKENWSKKKRGIHYAICGLPWAIKIQLWIWGDTDELRKIIVERVKNDKRFTPKQKQVIFTENVKSGFNINDWEAEGKLDEINSLIKKTVDKFKSVQREITSIIDNSISRCKDWPDT